MFYFFHKTYVFIRCRRAVESRFEKQNMPCSFEKNSMNVCFCFGFQTTNKFPLRRVSFLCYFAFCLQKTGFLSSDNLIADVEAHLKAVFLDAWSGVDPTKFEIALKR